MAKTTYNGESDTEKIRAKILEGLREPINQFAEDFYEKILEEIPKNKYISKTTDEHPEPLKKSIKWVRARINNKSGVYTITYKFPKYAKNILEGVKESDGIYHYAKENQWMIFNQKAFPKGNRNPRYYKNGIYFFKRVKYRVKKNDFFTRAWRKMERRVAYDKLANNMAKVIKYI